MSCTIFTLSLLDIFPFSLLILSSLLSVYYRHLMLTLLTSLLFFTFIFYLHNLTSCDFSSSYLSLLPPHSITSSPLTPFCNPSTPVSSFGLLSYIHNLYYLNSCPPHIIISVIIFSSFFPYSFFFCLILSPSLFIISPSHL